MQQDEGHIAAPTVRKLFTDYPLPPNDDEAIASLVGANASTIRNWMRGNIKPNTRAFDLIVSDYLKPRYGERLDDDVVQLARLECTTRSRKAKRGHAPGPPREHIAAGQATDYQWVLHSLRKATDLTSDQRLELIAILTGKVLDD